MIDSYPPIVVQNNYSWLLPLYSVVLGSLVLLLNEILFKEKGRKVAPLIASFFLLVSLLSSFKLYFSFTETVSLFSDTMRISQFSIVIWAICLLSAFACAVYSCSYLEKEKAVTGEYYSLLLMTTAGLLTLASSYEWITAFVGLELLSLGAYVMAGYFRNKERSIEASGKYFVVGMFASAILLFGIAWIYGYAGSTHFAVIQALASQSPTTAPYLLAGALLITVGFGFKVAAVPFHAWAPDVYDGAIAPVTSFLSTAVKASAFSVLVVVFSEIFLGVTQLGSAVCILAIASMIIGNLGALAQSSVKRLLAYSSIAHAGYLLVGISTLGKANPESIQNAVAFYLLAYTLMTVGAFGVLILVAGLGEKRLLLEDYAGLGLKHPFLGICMTVFLFSLAGMPPTAGFFGKYYLFKLAIDQGQVALVITAVLTSLVSFYYYIRVVVYLYMKPSNATSEVTVQPSTQIVIGACAILLFVASFFSFRF